MANSTILFKFDVPSGEAQTMKGKFAKKHRIGEDNVYLWPDQFISNFPSASMMYLHIRKCRERLCLHAPQSDEQLLSHIEELLSGKYLATPHCTPDEEEKKTYIRDLVEEIEKNVARLSFNIIKDIPGHPLAFALSYGPSLPLGKMMHERLQKLLEKCAKTDSTFDIDDRFPDDKEFKVAAKSSTGREENDFYFPYQVAIGKIIVERIKILLKFKKKSFNDFKKFKFQIYTAKCNMLQQQTSTRLADERSQCFPAKCYTNKKKLSEKAKKRVLLYRMSSAVKQRQEKLLKKAKARPDTLFLIIGDEAHWGTCHKTDTGNESAAHAMLNTWKDETPNVFVLLVTATPYNLLTDTSRIPFDRYVARSLHDPEEWHQVEMTGYSGRSEIVEKGGKKLTGKTGPVRNLHIIKWTEGFTDVLRKGITVKMMVFKKKHSMPLYAADDNTHPGQLTWTTKKTAGRQYDTFRITETGKGGNGVKIETADEKYYLVCISGKGGGTVKHRLVFLKNENTRSRGNEGMEYQNEFSFHQNSGYGIFELRVSLKLDQDKTSRIMSLAVNDKGDIDLESRLPPEYFPDGANFGYSVHDNEYSFLFENKEEELTDTKEYLSMNTLFNSMRNESPSHQLIREDVLFQKVMKKMEESEPTDILAAEYCYNILAVPLFKRSKFVANSVEDLFKNPDATLDNYHENKTKLLNEFEKKLEEIHLSANVFKPISQSTFKEYQSRMADVAKDLLLEDLDNLLAGRINEEDFITTVVSTLIYPGDKMFMYDAFRMLQSNEDIAESVARTFTNHNKDAFSHVLQQALLKRETSRIIGDLSDNNFAEEVISGHMTVVRINREHEGNRLYKSLITARNVIWAQRFPFEVIRDFGNFTLEKEVKGKSGQPIQRICRALQYRGSCKKCSCSSYQGQELTLQCGRCKHEHTSVITYEDLQDLPCILILNQRGRMGDTFPSTLNVLDCRIQHTAAQLYLSTIVQEIGRLCRYISRKDKANLPYALVGKHLGKRLRDSLGKSASYYAEFALRGDLDRYVLKKKRILEDPERSKKDSEKMGIGEAGENSYDCNNTDEHGNRLLLMAEPQIGKTGAYLYAISEIQRIIENNEESTDEYTTSEDEPDTYSTCPVEGEYESVDKWKFPYWCSLKDQAKLPKQLRKSKYASTYGPYQQGRKPEDLMDRGLKVEKRTSKPRKVLPTFGTKYKACDLDHECDHCKRRGTPEKREFQFESSTVQISYPNASCFDPLVNKLNDLNCATTDKPHQGNGQSEPILKTWIFTPSHERYDKGCFNLNHTMVDQSTNQVAQHVHIIVVRKSCFSKYCKKWGATHAILQLPDKMADSDTGVDDGGVGYARLFIQRLAEKLCLPYIFMLDDNISTMARAKELNGKISRSTTGMLEWENVPFYEVLKHLEDQIMGEGNVPRDLKYERFDPKRPLSEVHQYSGPPECYGVSGFLKFRPTIGNVRQPFKRQHVFSCVLLNINALKEKSIRYKPWQVYEDCNLNNEADDKGLLVCKYSRYVMMKKYSQRWFSEIYFWRNSTNLAFNPTRETPTDQSDRLVSWIEKTNLPKNVEVWPQDSDLGTRLMNVCSKTNGRSLILVVWSSQPNFDLKGKLLQDKTRNFVGTTDEADVSQYLIILPKEHLKKLSLVTQKNIRDFFGSGLEDKFLPIEVISTHDPNIYDIRFAVVYLKNKHKTRCENVVRGKEPNRTEMNQETTRVHENQVSKQDNMDQIENGLDNTKIVRQHHDRYTGNSEVNARYFLPLEEIDENINKDVGVVYILETLGLSDDLAGILFYLEKRNYRLIIRPLEQTDNSTIALAISKIFTDFGQPYLLQSGNDAGTMKLIVDKLKDVHPGLDILIKYKEEEELELFGENLKKELESQPPQNTLYYLKEQQMRWNEKYSDGGVQKTTLTELLPGVLPNPGSSQFQELQQNPKQVVYRVKGQELTRNASGLSTITRNISGTLSLTGIDKHRNCKDGTGVQSAPQSNAPSDSQNEKAASSALDGGQCSFAHVLSTHNNHHRDDGRPEVQNSGYITEMEVTRQGTVEREVHTPKPSTSKRSACSDRKSAAKRTKLIISDTTSASEPKTKCGCRTKCKSMICSCRKAGSLCTKGVCHSTQPDCDNMTFSRDRRQPLISKFIQKQ